MNGDNFWNETLFGNPLNSWDGVDEQNCCYNQIKRKRLDISGTFPQTLNTYYPKAQSCPLSEKKRINFETSSLSLQKHFL